MDIDVVIIGVNTEKTLAKCIESVRESRYTEGKIHTVYVDGGSTDGSIALARGYAGVRVVEIHPAQIIQTGPTPGLGRNAGWRAGVSPLVQFLDSDTIMDPDWLVKAASAMSPDVGAVRGNRDEINPHASVYNWIGNMEWNAPPGECEAFGGDVLVRRSILEETGGYDEVLVGGEDPELSQRVRLKGWKIIQLNEPMTRHDLAMTKVSQYWKRCFRTGYGFAAVTARFARSDYKGATKGFWFHELIRIVIRGGGFLGFSLLALAGIFFCSWSLFLLLPGLLLLFFPRIFRLSWFMKDKGLSKEQARTYALHCSLIVIPEFFGLARFYYGQATGKPLRNKRSGLGSHATNTQEGRMGILKKVVYLASEYPGISHTFIFREIRSLRQQGFRVMTASIRRPGNLEKMTADEKADAHKTLYIKDSAVLKVIASHMALLFSSPKPYFFMLRQSVWFSRMGFRNIFKAMAYFAEAGVLLRWMHNHQMTHVHVHFANPAATVAMIAATYGSISYSLSVHGPDVFYNVDTILLAEKVKRASAVRCISYYCRSQLMRLVPHDLWPRFHIVRCGIDPARFAPRPEPENEISEILCLGRLVPAKGQHILLEACGVLKQRNIPFHLTYVGGGEDRGSLEDLAGSLGIAHAVEFTGAVGQDEVHGYYDRADLFVLASFAEGVPVVLMEAMAKEVVSVSTRITGHPELIEDGVDGILVAPSDVEGLADKLQKLISDPVLRRKLGVQGRLKVLEVYDLDRNCKQMAEFFSHC
jgi:colanic acid/amylovoran biosynthesis glycosyltransferase